MSDYEETRAGFIQEMAAGEASTEEYLAGVERMRKLRETWRSSFLSLSLSATVVAAQDQQAAEHRDALLDTENQYRTLARRHVILNKFTAMALEAVEDGDIDLAWKLVNLRGEIMKARKDETEVSRKSETL